MEQTVQLMTASAETCQLIQGWDKQARARMKERQRADHPQATVSAVLLTVWGLVLHALVFGKCDPRINGLTFQPENLGWYQKKRSFVKHYNRFLGGGEGNLLQVKELDGQIFTRKNLCSWVSREQRLLRAFNNSPSSPPVFFSFSPATSVYAKWQNTVLREETASLYVIWSLQLWGQNGVLCWLGQFWWALSVPTGIHFSSLILQVSGECQTFA